MSFAGLGFLAFYISGKLHLFDGRGHAVRIILEYWEAWADIFHPVVQTRKGMAGSGAVGRRRLSCYIADDGLQTCVHKVRHVHVNESLTCVFDPFRRSLGGRLHRRLPRLRHRLLLVQAVLPEPRLAALGDPVRASARAQRPGAHGADPPDCAE